MSIISNINPYDNSYKSIDFNKSLFQVIPEEYFSPNYKIKSYMLNKSFDDLLDFSEDVINTNYKIFTILANRKMRCCRKSLIESIRKVPNVV